MQISLSFQISPNGMWFVISSQTIHKAVLDSIFQLNEITSTLPYKIGTGRACEIPNSCLGLIDQLTSSAFPCTHTFYPGVLVHQNPFCSSHFITRPFMCAILSKNIRIQNHIAQLQRSPGGAGSRMEPREISKKGHLWSITQYGENRGLPFSNEFCLSTFLFKLYMCLTFLRTRNIQQCFLLCEKWKYVLI